MQLKDSPEVVMLDHMSPEQARMHRPSMMSRALVREAGMRAMAALKTLRLERRMQEKGVDKPLPEGTLKKLEATLKQDVETWLAGTACPHCGGFIGDS